MAKITLATLASGYVDVDALNNNFQLLAAAVENLLSRDGTSPNQMEADLDLNGHALLNTMVNPNDPASLVSLATMQSYVDARASGLLMQKHEDATATVGQTVFVLSDFTYEAGANNLAVYVDGVRVFAPTEFTETNSSTVTFAAPMVGGEVVQFVTNDFVGTIGLPPHTHDWSDLTGLPAFASRWPTYAEVTDKPATFAPSAHTHSAAEVVSGRLADPQRGVHVQSGTPTATTVGEIWLW